MRYKNAFPKGKLLYLTLSGDESEQDSSKDYTTISYKEDIIKWLEECKKVAVNNPTLRETLTQYINLIKKLTHQTMNVQLNEELAKLFTESPKNFDTLMAVRNLDLRNFAFQQKIIPVLSKLEEEIDGFGFEKDLDKLNKKYSHLCWVDNDKLKEKNVKILFEFEEKNTNFLIGGFSKNFSKNKDEYTKLHLLLEEEIKRIDNRIQVCKSDGWPFYFHYYYMNWTKNLKDLRRFIFDEFEEDIKSKIEMMLKIFDEAF